MKLTKFEQIAIIVFLVAIILVVAGIFLVYPQIQENQKLSKEAVSLQGQLDEKLAVIAQGASANEAIALNYQAGEMIAEYFYPEMTTYDADEIVREFLSDVGLKTNNLSVSSIDVKTFSPQFFIAPEVNYPIKDSAAAIYPENRPLTSAAKFLKDYIGAPNAEATVACINLNLEIDATKADIETLMDYVAKNPKAAIINSVEIPYTIPDKEEQNNTPPVQTQPVVFDEEGNPILENEVIVAPTRPESNATDSVKYNLDITLLMVDRVVAPPEA